MKNSRKSAKETAAEPWESQCKQCGFCCFEKVENDNGTIFYTQTPCRYLNIVTRQCKVYKRRFSINPECVQLTQELVATLKWLHPECGYRQGTDQCSSRQD